MLSFCCRWEAAMDSKARKPNSVHSASLRALVVPAETDILVCNACSHDQVSVSTDWQSHWHSVSARPLCSCWYADGRNGCLKSSGLLPSFFHIYYFQLVWFVLLKCCSCCYKTLPHLFHITFLNRLFFVLCIVAFIIAVIIISEMLLSHWEYIGMDNKKCFRLWPI